MNLSRRCGSRSASLTRRFAPPPGSSPGQVLSAGEGELHPLALLDEATQSRLPAMMVLYKRGGLVSVQHEGGNAEAEGPGKETAEPLSQRLLGSR